MTWQRRDILLTIVPMELRRGTGLMNVGYAFQYAGENLAVNFTESTDVDQAWMNSPDHRSNILNKIYRNRYRHSKWFF
jgi:hypothetical protein